MISMTQKARLRLLKLMVAMLVLNAGLKADGKVGCNGRFVNPISDVCWSCLFPITILGVKIVGGGPDTPST